MIRQQRTQTTSLRPSPRQLSGVCSCFCGIFGLFSRFAIGRVLCLLHLDKTFDCDACVTKQRRASRRKYLLSGGMRQLVIHTLASSKHSNQRGGSGASRPSHASVNDRPTRNETSAEGVAVVSKRNADDTVKESRGEQFDTRRP